MLEQITIMRIQRSRLSETAREASEFGTVFSDHMFVADYERNKWGNPQIIPYGPLPLHPSLSALHYGQAAFEGFKAFRAVDGRIALFRPRDNHARLNRTAARLAMPEAPESLFIDGVMGLVRFDRQVRHFELLMVDPAEGHLISTGGSS